MPSFIVVDTCAAVDLLLVLQLSLQKRCHGPACTRSGEGGQYRACCYGSSPRRVEKWHKRDTLCYRRAFLALMLLPLLAEDLHYWHSFM